MPRELCKHENPKTGHRCRLPKGHDGTHRWWTSAPRSTKRSERWVALPQLAVKERSRDPERPGYEQQPPLPSPCGECPFRRKAWPGYLGANAPEDFLLLAKETTLPCHTKVDYEQPGWEEAQKTVPQCAGQAIFLRNHCHVPRNPNVYVAEEPDTEQVLANSQEFRQHHIERSSLKKE